MRVIVLREFRDKDHFSKVYEEDEIYEFDETRAGHLSRLGLVEIIDDTLSEWRNPFTEDERPSIEELRLIAQEMGYTLQAKPTEGDKDGPQGEKIIGQGIIDSKEGGEQNSEKVGDTQVVTPDPDESKKEKKCSKQ